MGTFWRAQHGSDCDGAVDTVALVVIILTWVYIIVASAVFLLSWCCSCFSTNLARANESIENSVFGAFLGNDGHRNARNNRSNRQQSNNRGGGVATAAAAAMATAAVAHVVQPSHVSVSVNNSNNRSSGGSGGRGPKGESDSQMAARLQREEQARAAANNRQTQQRKFWLVSCWMDVCMNGDG